MTLNLVKNYDEFFPHVAIVIHIFLPSLNNRYRLLTGPLKKMATKAENRAFKNI